MKTLCSLVILLLIGSYSNAQQLNKNSASRDTQQSANHEQTFESYCLAHAVTLMDLPEGKANQYAIAGEVKQSPNKSASYVDYGIQLKEEETQYFQISGTTTILKAESLYRLRLAYALSQQKL
jgi:hypothetical protein